jgi:hypothetical protein
VGRDQARCDHECLNVDPTYVSQVERGRRGVRWYTVVRFLTALEATQHQLADELETKGARVRLSRARSFPGSPSPPIPSAA